MTSSGIFLHFLMDQGRCGIIMEHMRGGGKVSLFGFDEQYAMFDITPVSNQFLLEFMPMAKGDYVKVYLYGLMQCHHPQADSSMEQMSHELGLSEDEVLAAFRYWERKGLVQRTSDRPPRFRYVNVNKLIFMGGAPQEDVAYATFAEALHGLFGNDYWLHGKQVSAYYEWVEEMHLPMEAVLALIEHMIATRGKGFSLAAAQKLAVELAEAGVRTASDAEAVLNRDRHDLKGSRDVLRRFSLFREPTQPEMALYHKWAREWGFEPEAILAACDYTTNGKAPSFKYLDTILKNQRAQMGEKNISFRQMEKARAERESMEEPLRKLLSVMNIAGVTVNDGTISVYQDMRKLYPDEIILMAGRICSVASGDLLMVQEMLEAWKEKGLQTAEEIRQYVNKMDELNRLGRQLYQLWGRRSGVKASDRQLMQLWQDEWGFSNEMIIACAAYAADKEKPMQYLNGVLRACKEKGYTTPEEIMRDRSEWQKQFEQSTQQKPKGKVVREQQYTQREYDEQNDMPDWMAQRWKEMNGDA